MTLPARRVYWALLNQAAVLAVGLPRFSKTLAVRLLGQSDYARWSDAGNLEAWWEARTVKLAALVPAHSRVIEFGAGSRRLPVHLDRSCTYIPSDLIARDPTTFVCDLNRRPLPDLQNLSADTAVFSGVLEYLTDVPAVARWLSSQITTCVVSYEGVGSRRRTIQRLRERIRRRSRGYLNDYEPAELLAIFETAGFGCTRAEQWNSQKLYVLSHTGHSGAR